MAKRPASAAAPKAPILGKQSKATLPKEVFAEAFHPALVHEAARAEAAARRRGTASTLGRGEVSMTGAKAWRQKGTGRARAGALSVPHRRGGGVAFGPKPRHHVVKVNRKARRRALRGALSVHAERGTIAVVDAAAFEEPSTKQAAQALDRWGARRPTLVVLDPEETAAAKSFRNLPRVSVLPASAAGVADVVGHASLVVSERALEVLEARAADVDRKGNPDPDPAAPGVGSRSRSPRRSRGQVMSAGDKEAAGSGSEQPEGSDS
jgi:large subunit ribosomal protein L4